MFHTAATPRLGGPKSADSDPTAAQLELHHHVWMLSTVAAALHEALERHPLPHPHLPPPAEVIYPHRESPSFEMARMCREMGHL